MIRRVTSAILLVTALGHASAATASDALLKEKLAPKIGAACHSGIISAAKLGGAIYASQVAPLTQEYAWIAGGPPAIAKAAFEGTSNDNQASLYLLRRLTETWLAPSDGGANFLPLNDGGIEIRHANGTAAGTAEAKEALTDILSGRDSRFIFRCLVAAPATPAEKPQEKASPISISIARSPNDLTLPLDKKSFAEVAYVNDKTKDDRSISIYATVGASFGELTPVRRNAHDEGLLVRAIPSLFVQLEREGLKNGDAGDKVNNLNFGGSVSGFLQPRHAYTRTIYYSLSARYLTDTGFDSSAWAADFSLTPQLPISGNLVPYDLIPERLVLQWLLSGVADYHHVSDPGSKEELLDQPNFFRAGFDFSGSLRFLLDSSREHAIALTGSYQLREAFGQSVGDAHRLSLGLTIEPSPFYNFGLTFESGRNLDSLEFSKVWKATFGIRR